MKFRCHSDKQQLALTSEKPIIICATGIQWGKTETGSVKTKSKYHIFNDKHCNFLVTAPTYKIMRQSTYPSFMKWCGMDGVYNKKDDIFQIRDGGTIYFRSMTDPDSIVGMTDVYFVWMDECGLYSLYAWENIQGRAAFKQAQIIGTTSPYSLNWIYKEIIRPKQKEPNARPDVELIQAKSNENPYFPMEYYEQKRKTMDPKRFRMMFGGEWEKMEGLVYDCFDEELNTCDDFYFPAGTKFYCGIDWGYTNPFALVLRAITPDGNHYQVSEIYRSGLTISEIGKLIGKLKIHWPIEMCYCDPSNPQNIEELNRLGISAVGANNDIRYGIDCHYDLIRSRRYKVFKNYNRFTLDEYEAYHYPTEDDVEADKDIKEVMPVKQDDHAMDANRYVTVETYRQLDKTPVTMNYVDKKYKFPLDRHYTTNQFNQTKLKIDKNLTETWD